MTYKAVGIHAFAGGFTQGVKKTFDVQCQLEQHNFGGATCEKVARVSFVNEPDAKWPRVEAEFAYGNPRCTGFSTITSGAKYAGRAHGACAYQTQDIRTLVAYAAGHYPVVAFESVQQAYRGAGRPLIDELVRDVFVPKGYRVAHVFMSAQAFGNSQLRRRYFFVAYRRGLVFNVEPPSFDPYYLTLYDAIGHRVNRETREYPTLRCDEYDEDCFQQMNDEDRQMIPRLPNAWDYNVLARHTPEALTPHAMEKWQARVSDVPFGIHGPYRAQWLRPSPTLTSTQFTLVHPLHHRYLTVGEFMDMMGWDEMPAGPHPLAQMAKGLVPAVAEWFGRQVKLCLDGAWGTADWESRYDANTGEWVGGDAADKDEKTLDLTAYVPRLFDVERYPEEVRIAPHGRMKNARRVLRDAERSLPSYATSNYPGA